MDACVDDVGSQCTFRVFEAVRPDIRRCSIDAYLAQRGDLLRFNPSTLGPSFSTNFHLSNDMAQWRSPQNSKSVPKVGDLKEGETVTIGTIRTCVYSPLVALGEVVCSQSLKAARTGSKNHAFHRPRQFSVRARSGYHTSPADVRCFDLLCDYKTQIPLIFVML